MLTAASNGPAVLRGEQVSLPTRRLQLTTEGVGETEGRASLHFGFTEGFDPQGLELGVAGCREYENGWFPYLSVGGLTCLRALTSTSRRCPQSFVGACSA